MDSLESLFFRILNTTGNEERIGHSIVGNYEVDTVYTVDQGYETAIWKTGNSWDMIVVQRYEAKDEAIEGHSLWIEYCNLILLARILFKQGAQRYLKMERTCEQL